MSIVGVSWAMAGNLARWCRGKRGMLSIPRTRRTLAARGAAPRWNGGGARAVLRFGEDDAATRAPARGGGAPDGAHRLRDRRSRRRPAARPRLRRRALLRSVARHREPAAAGVHEGGRAASEVTAGTHSPGRDSLAAGT